MDFDMDGEMELVMGFDNGEIEVRKHRTGDLVHQQKMPSGKPVSKLMYYDYRQQAGKQKQLVAVDGEGNVKGFTVSASIEQFKVEVTSEEQVKAEEVLALN